MGLLLMLAGGVVLHSILPLPAHLYTRLHEHLPCVQACIAVGRIVIAFCLALLILETVAKFTLVGGLITVQCSSHHTPGCSGRLPQCCFSCPDYTVPLAHWQGQNEAPALKCPDCRHDSFLQIVTASFCR